MAHSIKRLPWSQVMTPRSWNQAWEQGARFSFLCPSALLVHSLSLLIRQQVTTFTHSQDDFATFCLTLNYANWIELCNDNHCIVILCKWTITLIHIMLLFCSLLALTMEVGARERGVCSQHCCRAGCGLSSQQVLLSLASIGSIEYQRIQINI